VGAGASTQPWRSVRWGWPAPAVDELRPEVPVEIMSFEVVRVITRRKGQAVISEELNPGEAERPPDRAGKAQPGAARRTRHRLRSRQRAVQPRRQAICRPEASSHRRFGMPVAMRRSPPCPLPKSWMISRPNTRGREPFVCVSAEQPTGGPHWGIETTSPLPAFDRQVR
jgi:hypothetical protein